MTKSKKRKQSCHSFSIYSSWLLWYSKGALITKMEEEKKTVRCCSECKTTKTPMWRGGPSGPKSLCNACGIRLRKQRRSELLSIRIIHSHKAYKKINPSPSSLSFSHGGVSLRKRRILKEEEQAALCLLLLSSNSAFT
ncbi:unnamed protein product [Brassica rapa]|uniref:GATA-type domain-containing protein n=1 Tax=Brassica campestris TaxID=3711 RepID=A0A3P5YXM2_BRACM|nr:unnamed protein product [Brassica rapa]VDC68095.1 unnamed protein product [Brassica rapa]